MARIHLRSWTRIGIAASVIWFVIFGGYLIATWSGELRDSYKHQLDTCYRTLSFELQSAEPREPKGSSEYKNCIAEVRVGEIGSKDLLNMLLMDIGTIIFGWIAVMSATLAIRWIKKGFA